MAPVEGVHRQASGAAARADVNLPGDEVEQVLGNLARGIPIAVAGLPYVR